MLRTLAPDMIFQEETLVNTVLALGPQAVQFFMQRRLGCAGCRMATFCTLAEVAKDYDLCIDQFLLDLRNTLQG